MSQQTQLARVVEYFQRWVQKWPTVQAGFPTNIHAQPGLAYQSQQSIMLYTHDRCFPWPSLFMTS